MSSFFFNFIGTKTQAGILHSAKQNQTAVPRNTSYTKVTKSLRATVVTEDRHRTITNNVSRRIQYLLKRQTLKPLTMNRTVYSTPKCRIYVQPFRLNVFLMKLTYSVIGMWHSVSMTPNLFILLQSLDTVTFTEFYVQTIKCSRYLSKQKNRHD